MTIQRLPLIVLTVSMSLLIAPMLLAEDGPPEVTAVTAGFHIRGPNHPAGGRRAWCIGEEGLRNPYNNRTTLAEGFPLTEKGEEDWPHEWVFEEFSTPVWTLGEGMSQRNSEAPVLVAEIEDLDVDLFDARGTVGMMLLCDDGFELGLLNRQNFRYVHVLGDPVAKSLQGRANIAYGHLRGNAGGHVMVTCRSFRLTVTVENNPGFIDTPPAVGIPPRDDTLYVDGQSAAVTVSFEPEYYKYLLENVVWDHVRTEPEVAQMNNPEGVGIDVFTDDDDMSKAEVPNVRWVGIQTGVDSRFGTPEYCNDDITWVIDGTFTLNDGYQTFDVRPCQPGELIATVLLGQYNTGSAAFELKATPGVISAVPDPLHENGFQPVIGPGDMKIKLESGPIQVLCLPDSQFYALIENHELRHVQQYDQRLGPFGMLTVDFFMDLWWLTLVDMLEEYSGDDAFYPFSEGIAELIGELAFTAANQAMVQPFVSDSSPQGCWLERDADQFAESAAERSWYYSIECVYSSCKGVPDPIGCGIPDGQSSTDGDN